VREGVLAGVETVDIPRAALDAAAEILVFGTTPDVTAVVQFDGRPVGPGRPGPVQAVLNRLLAEDIRGNADMRTPVDPE
jgi:branched-subunit amino acid aminotransferase/4-amino-4-deoxychorismate lyase